MIPTVARLLGWDLIGSKMILIWGKVGEHTLERNNLMATGTTWEERVKTSLADFLEAQKEYLPDHMQTDPDYDIAASLEDTLADALLDVSRTDFPGVEFAYRQFLKRQIGLLSFDYFLALRECGSEIERPMFLALSTAAAQSGPVTFRHRIGTGGYVTSSESGIVIQAQAKIGDYRVDFLLTREWEDVKILGNEKYRVENKRKRLILECDGHDYHERTKEQASRDKERDRFFQSIGYNVFRYTGADIWKDVFACANEVIELMIESDKGNFQTVSTDGVPTVLKK